MFCSTCGTKSNDETQNFCRACGTALPADAVSLSKQGAPAQASISQQSAPSAVITDTLPDGIKGWSWGAFLLNWVWAVGNRTWIGLLALIPYVGFGIAIWLGIKGREMAWKNGQWESVEHFNRVQKKWSQWGVGILIACCAVGVVLGIAAPMYMSRHHDSAEDQLNAEMASILASTNDSRPASLETAPQPVAQTTNGALDSNADALPTPLDTVAGKLSKVEMPNGQNGIALNEQLLFSGDDANWQKPLHIFKLPDQREYILMASSGGRGNSCETLYYFLIADHSGVRATPEFGTCSPQGTYRQDGSKVTLTLPMMGGHSTIVFDGTTVTEDGKVVELSDSNDPSK